MHVTTPFPFRHALAICLIAILTGCVQDPSVTLESPTMPEPEPTPVSHEFTVAAPSRDDNCDTEDDGSLLVPESAALAEKDDPDTTTPAGLSAPGQEKTIPVLASPPKKRSKASKQCYSHTAKADKKRCEPQCIPYVRCRSGISSCQIGYENGPLTWFSCEQKRRNTSNQPEPGSILILAADTRHNMATGHGLYVESSTRFSDSTYRLVLSHTNFDRQCSIETNIEAELDTSAMTLKVLSGAWKDWGNRLKVSGFIHNNG